jgi:phenylalanyl-tRNA synthetase alpha chain
MEVNDPPVRIVVPGRVFRPDTIDARHYNTFHQVEGLAVEPGLAFADLKGVLEAFVKACFGRQRRMRLRPSFFPFTEPSAEVDMTCLCDAKGCGLCGGQGWIEILGCGMVHDHVFRWVDDRRAEAGKPRAYDPERVTGFAFGMGVERIASLKFGIPDVRLFYQNDLRFLRQF